MNAESQLALADALTRARSAYDDLLALGEEVEDEWSYVNDLAAAWHLRLDDVESRRGAEPLSAELDAAVTALIAEAAAIDDRHRAIDWLSTFPLVLLSALGERP